MAQYVVRRDARASAAGRRGRYAHIESAVKMRDQLSRAPSSVKRSIMNAYDDGIIGLRERRKMLAQLEA